jgi:hypothetical protein
VVINGIEYGPDAYVEGLHTVVRSFPDCRWGLRQLVIDPP